MTTPRTLTLLLAALVMAPLACAQQGPVPGSDPVSYAKGHYGAQAENATADPAGYAQGQASADAAANQTRTAAFIACWAAYDAAGMVADPVCAPFFTPPERAPRPHAEDNTTQEARDALNATADGAAEFANTTLDVLNRTVQDPGSAPSQLRRLVDAAASFANATVSVVVRLVRHAVGGAVDLVVGIVECILHGLGLAAKGAGMAGGAVADGIHALLDGVVSGATATADGVGALVKGLLDGLGSASSAAASGVGRLVKALADGISSAASATADAVAAAGKATADAAVSAAQAVGHAVGSAFDAITHLFGGHSGKDAQSGPVGRLGKSLPLDDPLGKIRGTLSL
jgi:hypothetical protein